LERTDREHLTDYARATIPNVGGISEFMKIAALCETHYVGMIPHFTGPISEAAMVHCSAAFSGPVLMEMVMGGTAGVAVSAAGVRFQERQAVAE
jgi:galactonate dehydratase